MCQRIYILHLWQALFGFWSARLLLSRLFFFLRSKQGNDIGLMFGWGFIRIGFTFTRAMSYFIVGQWYFGWITFFSMARSTCGYLWAKNSATASIEGEVAVANFGDLGKTLAPLALAHPAMAGWSVPPRRFSHQSIFFILPKYCWHDSNIATFSIPQHLSWMKSILFLSSNK